MGVSARRKIPNVVVDRKALLRLSIPFLALILISVGLELEMRREILEGLKDVRLQGAENLAAMNTLLDLQRSITTLGSCGLVAIAFICLVFWLRLTHRVFGPTIPMRRHVRQLIEGNYGSRIRLRKGDEFQDFGAELNTLAETLESKAVVK